MGVNTFPDSAANSSVSHATTSLLSTVDNVIKNTTTSVILKKPIINNEDDFDNLIAPTAEGLIRLRELHNYMSEELKEKDSKLPNIRSRTLSNNIRARHYKTNTSSYLNDSSSSNSSGTYREFQNEVAKFPQESLHSFRFSSSSPISGGNMKDELSKRKKRLHGTLPGHQLMKPSLNRIKTNTVGSPVTIGNGHFRRKSLPPLSESPPKSNTNTTSEATSRTMSNYSTNSSSSSSISTSPTTEDEADIEEDCYVPHLHNRLKQQNQAILTTYDDWRIILTNSIAQDVLVSHLHHKINEEQDMLLVGKSVMDLVEPSYQSRLRSLIGKRRNELIKENAENSGGMVLVCGNVIPIIKLDGTKSSASLWLKEKVNEAGSSVFIWIFEEVYESSILLSVDEQGSITTIMDEEGVRDLYGYEAKDLIDEPLDVLVPSLSTKCDSNWKEKISQLRFFGSCTKKGAQFPIIVRREENAVRITSMPVIAGLMTIKRDGIIEGCNDIFVKYLFGFSQVDLVEKKNISQLLPQFPALLKNLKRDDLLQPGLIINNIICRKLLLSTEKQQQQQHDSSNMLVNHNKRMLTHTPNNQPLPILVAMHRDGTPFEVQLQLKLVETEEEEYALWISFDREVAFKRFGHHHLISLPPQDQQQQQNAVTKVYPPTDTVIPPPQPPSEEKKVQVHRGSPSVTSISCDTNSVCNNKTVPAPYSKTNPPLATTKEEITYSAQTNSVTIDDYIILDDLGQGAYGLVKMAVKKDDPIQRKVVIKYVIKSRILVDCWTRDRKLGTIPVEIHILHTLRKLPHENLGDMLDYFEDSDYYYIVMGLHGEGMDLFDYIELNDHIEEKEICRMFKQIALGVRHLHDNKIVHRDIKDENVVLDQENGGLRLIDFGSAAYLKPGRKYETFVGTLDYAAPEILRGHTYSGKPQDVWALGILLFTLVYRENPFYDIDEIMGRELRIPFVLSEGSVDLISRMLERDVDKRIDIHQVLAHPWLN